MKHKPTAGFSFRNALAGEKKKKTRQYLATDDTASWAQSTRPGRGGLSLMYWIRDLGNPGSLYLPTLPFVRLLSLDSSFLWTVTAQEEDVRDSGAKGPLSTSCRS